MIKNLVTLATSLGAFAVACLAQDQTVNGNLKIVGTSFELNGRHTHALDNLSGYTSNPSTDSYRYEVARICVNTAHWQWTGPIEVELRQTYWGPNGYLRFIITAGYQEATGVVTLVEKFGWALHANVTLGAPVPTGTSTGGFPNQYIPIYVDLGNYTFWHVQITHGWTVVVDDIPTDHAQFKFFSTPSQTVLSGYVAMPTGSGGIESREMFAGRVGIGTTAPAYPLAVRGGGNSDKAAVAIQDSDNANKEWRIDQRDGALRFTESGVAERMQIASTGNVGIGTNSPTNKLEVRSDGSGTVWAGRIALSNSTVDRQVFLGTYNGSAVAGAHNFALSAWAPLYVNTTNGISDGTDVILAGAGYVGIGTATPSHKLAVNGSVRAKEVIVDTGWADYVFADDYELKALAEVEAHIKAKRHLPGIPSAAEVAEHGVSIGEMQAKLLAKVEELTLYMIELKKENAELREQMKRITPAGTPAP